MALESGDYAAARFDWQRIIPNGSRLPLLARPAVPRAWPGYPDTTLDLAAVRARLVLVSILEGSRQRAAAELAEFARLHPNAQGRLGGKQGRYVDLLKELLAESTAWPAPAVESRLADLRRQFLPKQDRPAAGGRGRGHVAAFRCAERWHALKGRWWRAAPRADSPRPFRACHPIR